jgi:hypothetical protein
MTEKNLTPTKNTLATVALMLSIIGLVLSFFVIGIPLLVLSLLLGIIALFKAPRGKARASIILSIIPLGLFGWLIGMISRMLISATVEFTDWMQTEIKGNATMEAVFAQPGFRLFTEQKVRETIGRIDR